MNAILTFNENGTASCLWTDAIPLQEIGNLEICRASTIEFNMHKQVWEVRFSQNEGVVFSHASRAECIRWEVEQLTGNV